jgi:hypothetical protein
MPEMKNQKKLSIKVRDLEALKNVTGGRRHAQRLHAGALSQQLGEPRGGLGPLGRNQIQ